MRKIPDYRLVKRKAAELLEETGVVHPPINPISMAREQGFDVKFVSFSGDFAQVAGFYDPDEEAIYINKNESPLRQTFTIAHELGHALLHKDWAGSDDYKVFGEILNETTMIPMKKKRMPSPRIYLFHVPSLTSIIRD